MISTILTALALSTAHAEEAKPTLEWHLYGDAYYSYNFNQPAPVSGPTATSVSAAAIPNAQNTYRYYDVYHNQISLSLLELSVTAKYGETSLLADLDFGPYADLNATSTGASGKVVDEVSKHIGQAILTWKPEGSRFSFDVGKMYSHVGVESAKAKDNFNYSRTVLFSYGMPFWHTGVRVNYELVPNELQAMACVYNGWNSIYDNNNSKSLGGQLKYTPSPLATLTYNYLGGPERSDSERDWRVLHELNTTWNMSDRWAAITDLLTGRESDAPIGSTRADAAWYGGLVALRYALTGRSYLSPRFEMFRDQHGYILAGGPQTIRSGTMTYGHALSKGLDLRAEGRWDSSSQRPFSKGLASKDSQTTILTALLFTY